MIVYFAWVDPGTAFNSGTHAVYDEQIRSFDITHDEGSFAKLTLVIRNPKVGPLSAGRKLWAYLSVDTGSEVVPLFFGRLVALPSNILGELITYELLARPSDFADQKAALADTLRVLPFYDEVFVSEEQRDNPDAVLEGYSARWHIDRVTHEVTISDVLAGEDGVIEFGTADVPYNSLDVSIASAPLTAVTVKGSIPWLQGATGTLDMGTKIIPTLTSDSIVNNWPKTGDQLAGGYYVVSATAVNERPLVKDISWQANYSNREEKHNDGDVMSIQESFSGPSGTTALSGTTLHYYTESVNGDPATGTPASASINRSALIAMRGQIRATLVLGIAASRDRKDNVELTLESDLQPVLRDPDDTSDKELIDIGGVDVSKTCTSDPSPIDNAGRSEYVTTDRGIQSIEYMLARARARLLQGARVVDVSFNCRFDAAVGAELSCRKNGFIADSRIPGGEALGKIVSYSLRGDGSSGQFIATIKMSCAVGLGNTLETAAGSAEYVDNAYIDPSYQTHTGQVIALSSGDVGYSPPVLVDGGGGVFMANLSKSDLVIREEIVSSADEQQAAFGSGISPFPIQFSIFEGVGALMEANIRQAFDRMAQTEMWYELELKNLEGTGIEAHWNVPTAALVVPKQIDLTAA